MKNKFLFILFLFLVSCNTNDKKKEAPILNEDPIQETSLVILGTIQDGGSPHIACKKMCCRELFNRPEEGRNVVSIGIIDPQNQKKYIIECTPDFPKQAKQLLKYSHFTKTEMPDGIFLTHAHIGHYSGLMYLGKEAMNADTIPVYTMPRMRQFIETNGPWNQLVNNKNIVLYPLENNQRVKLTSNLALIPIVVPHRDEYSETVGYIIEGPSKKILFIPDIDKWVKWERKIIDIIAKVDFAFIDGTFYNGEEINTRNITTIPHPLIIESMDLFKTLPPEEKSKIHFIHFNHTNLVLDSTSKPYNTIIAKGFQIARIHQIIKL